jgi:uncharacterized protein (DUF433 family)
MSLSLEAGPVPLETTADGVVRIRGTRVPMHTVISAFDQGATAEEIVQRYTTLDLTDVYAVISFYLQQRAEVDAYRQQYRDGAARVRAQNEAGLDRRAIRERLLARRTGQAAVTHAASGG